MQHYNIDKCWAAVYPYSRIHKKTEECPQLKHNHLNTFILRNILASNRKLTKIKVH